MAVLEFGAPGGSLDIGYNDGGSVYYQYAYPQALAIATVNCNGINTELQLGENQIQGVGDAALIWEMGSTTVAYLHPNTNGTPGVADFGFAGGVRAALFSLGTSPSPVTWDLYIYVEANGVSSLSVNLPDNSNIPLNQWNYYQINTDFLAVQVSMSSSSGPGIKIEWYTGLEARQKAGKA